MHDSYHGNSMIDVVSKVDEFLKGASVFKDMCKKEHNVVNNTEESNIQQDNTWTNFTLNGTRITQGSKKAVAFSESYLGPDKALPSG
eukprot:12603104-Ditylum_brightwellii.AAC.1